MLSTKPTVKNPEMGGCGVQAYNLISEEVRQEDCRFEALLEYMTCHKSVK